MVIFFARFFSDVNSKTFMLIVVRITKQDTKPHGKPHGTKPHEIYIAENDVSKAFLSNFTKLELENNVAYWFVSDEPFSYNEKKMSGNRKISYLIYV